MIRGVLSGAGSLFVGFLVYSVLKFFGLTKNKSDRVIQKAKRNGCIKTAQLSQSRYVPGIPRHPDQGRRQQHWLVTYQYQVGEKLYRYRRITYLAPPETLELYYDPVKPGTAYAGREQEKSKAILVVYFTMLICFLVFYWIVFSFLPGVGE